MSGTWKHIERLIQISQKYVQLFKKNWKTGKNVWIRVSIVLLYANFLFFFSLVFYISFREFGVSMYIVKHTAYVSVFSAILSFLPLAFRLKCTLCAMLIINKKRIAWIGLYLLLT